MIKAVGKYIYVKRLRVAREGKIFLPKSFKENSVKCLILSVGNDVEDKTVVRGRLALFNLQAGIEDEKNPQHLFFQEKDIIMIDFGGMFRVLGNRILMRRDIEEGVLNIKKDDGSKTKLFIPACYQTKDQSLDGFYQSLGVKDNKIIKTDLLPGDRIQIKKWDASIHEIGMDGKYYLSVPLKLLSHKIENVT